MNYKEDLKERIQKLNDNTADILKYALLPKADLKKLIVMIIPDIDDIKEPIIRHLYLDESDYFDEKYYNIPILIVARNLYCYYDRNLVNSGGREINIKAGRPILDKVLYNYYDTK